MPPLAALLGALAINASWPLVARGGVEAYSPILFNSAGLLVGLGALSPWLLSHGRWRRLVSRELRWTFLGMGICSGLAALVFIAALLYTTPANAAIVAQVEVLYSALLCAWLLKEPIGREQAGASLLIVGGTSLVLIHDLSSPRWKGDLMILATPWLFQVSHILAKRLPKGLDPALISGGRVFYGLLFTAPACAWPLLTSPRWSWEPGPLAVVLAQGVGLSCLNFLLWYSAILRMDLAKATAIMLSYPALTLLFSWGLGQERVHAMQVAGLVVTFAGASWMSRLVLRAQAAAGVPPSKLIPPEAAEV